MANAIAAVDAVTHRGAPDTLFDAWADTDDWDQLLVRALIYRLATTGYVAAHAGVIRRITSPRPPPLSTQCSHGSDLLATSIVRCAHRRSTSLRHSVPGQTA